MKVLDFDSLNAIEYFLHRIIVIEQNRLLNTAFITPDLGRETNGIIFILSGDITYYSHNQPPLKAVKGDLVYIPHSSHYRCVFTSECDPPDECRFILINFEIFDSTQSPFLLSEIIKVIKPSNSIVYENSFIDILSIYRSGCPSPARLKACLYNILADVSNELYKKSISISQFAGIYRGIQYLEQHFTEDISILELSRMCHVSETSFRRLFHQYAGISPLEYRNKLKITRAIDLLRTGMFTVNQVAEELGFSDASYFSRAFRKATGVTPKDYKDKGHAVMLLSGLK